MEFTTYRRNAKEIKAIRETHTEVLDIRPASVPGSTVSYYAATADDAWEFFANTPNARVVETFGQITISLVKGKAAPTAVFILSKPAAEQELPATVTVEPVTEVKESAPMSDQATHVITFLDGTTERVTVTNSTYEPDASYGAVGTVTARTVNGVSRTYRFGPSGDNYKMETVQEYATRTDPATDEEIAEALAILRNGAVESHKTSIRKMVAFELDKRKLAVYADAGSDTWWTLSLWTPEDSYDTPSSEEFLTTDGKIVLVYDVDLYTLNSRVQYADASDGYVSVFDLWPTRLVRVNLENAPQESAHVIGTCAVCDYTGNVTKAFDTTLCEPCHVHCMLIRQRASKSQQESADQETPSSEEFVTDDGEILTVLSVNPQTHMARVAGWEGTFLREVSVWDLTPERLQEYSLDMLSAGGENNAAMRQAQTEEMRATSQAREASGLELDGWERELLASYDEESADEKRKRELRYLQRGLISPGEYREEITRIDSQESANDDAPTFWYH